MFIFLVTRIEQEDRRLRRLQERETQDDDDDDDRERYAERCVLFENILVCSF